MRSASAFILLIAAGGIGGLAGSIVGAAVGALFVGGFLGGLLLAPCGAWLAARFGLIDSADVPGVACGAAVGFLAAATIAVNTLQSPVGPVLSTVLVGAGGLVGGKLQARRRANTSTNN